MSVDPSWKNAYKAAGISLISDGVILGLFIPLAFSVGGALQATTGKELLESLSGNGFAFRLAIGLFALSGALNILAGPGLYLALKELRKTYALIATVALLMGTSVFLVGSSVFYAAATLSNGYSAATTDFQKASYIAAGDLLLGVVNASFVLTAIFSAVAIILYSIPMLKGVFGRGLGYVGIIAGLIRIPSSLPGLAIIAPIYGVLFFVWVVGVGWKLYRLG